MKNILSIKITRVKIKFLSVFITAAGFFLFSLPAFALTITPPIIDLTADPGETVDFAVGLLNETDETLFLALGFENFRPKQDDQSQPEFLPANSDQKNFLGWIAAPTDSVVLQPGQRQSIPFTITVPANAPIGGYYGIVLWKTAPSATEGTSGVSVASQVGNLVFLTVQGDIKRDFILHDFTINNTKLSHLPVKFNFAIENTGNIYIEPVGRINIKNIFGITTEVININPEKKRVFPGFTRTFDLAWDKEKNWPILFIVSAWPNLFNEINNFAFGRYKAEFVVQIDKSNKSVRAEQAFWVFPYRLVLSILAIIIIVFIFRLYRKLKRKKPIPTPIK